MTVCLACGAALCGQYADHVDHVDPRLGRHDSALKPTGSTRRWRRIRSFVLNRDSHRCQIHVDQAGAVVEGCRPEVSPAGPDDPHWLRALCPGHNLSRGASSTDARSKTAPNRTPEWSW